MQNQKQEPDNKEGNPEKAYSDEMAGKGTTFIDTPSESDARDKAKMEKGFTGETQKIDGVHPDELINDEEEMDDITRETLENK